MLFSRMRLRSAAVNRQSPPDVWYNSFLCFSGSDATYCFWCQSSRYWYAPSKNEPEPHAGSRMRSLAACLGVMIGPIGARRVSEDSESLLADASGSERL